MEIHEAKKKLIRQVTREKRKKVREFPRCALWERMWGAEPSKDSDFLRSGWGVKKKSQKKKKKELTGRGRFIGLDDILTSPTGPILPSRIGRGLRKKKRGRLLYLGPLEGYWGAI